MDLIVTRAVQPLRISGTVVFETADIKAAFTQQSDPDEDLFYDAFSEAWDAAPLSAKLFTLSRIASLAEAQASNLRLSGVVEPKK